MAYTHGLASTYRNYDANGKACRCDDCCRANTARMARERAARMARLAVDPSLAPHGRLSTYRNWGCRCAPCKQANVDASREYERRRRERRAES